MRTPPEWGLGGGFGAAISQQQQPLLHDGGRKQRDIFPLPLLHEFGHDGLSNLSRQCRRRAEYRCHLETEVNHTIRCLNEMYGAPQAAGTHGEAVAQRNALEFIEASVKQLGKPPTDLTASEALRLLRGASGYEDVQASGTVASFNLEAVSIPEAGWEPIGLHDLWGSNGRKIVDDFVQQQLLPPEEAKLNLDATGLGCTYWDPILRHRKTYAKFVKRLAASHLVDFSLSPVREEVSFFCVYKKNGRQRLIVDARRANAHFREPDYVHLTTGDGLGGLEFPSNSSVKVCTADLKDAFYHLALPVELRDVFGLPRVRAGDVGVFSLNGSVVSANQWLSPRLAVVPMGWSWALWICQSVHESIIDRTGLGESSRIRDRRVPPDASVCHTEYVDNLIVLGTDKDQVQYKYDKAVRALKDAGLQVHEEEVNDEGAEILGWELSRTGQFRPTRKRAWKVRLALRGLLAIGRSSSKQLEKVMGHCSFLCLGRREAFSIFGQVYSFIKQYKHCSDEKPLWRSVRRELRIFDGIIPLIQRDLCLPWCTTVHATDASEWGLGVTCANMPYDMVNQLGVCNERWRFKEIGGNNPRQRILEEQSGDKVYPFYNQVEEDQAEIPPPNFSSVPFEAVKRDWRTVVRHKWRAAGSLPVYEARSTLGAVKHVLRSTDNFGKKHLVFSDSMTSTCAISRGRAQSFHLRHVCAQIGALALATNSSFHIRWIPSEWNPADNPSRGIWAPSIPDQFLQHGFSEKSGRGGPAQMERRSMSQQCKTEAESLETCGEQETDATGNPSVHRDTDRNEQRPEGSEETGPTAGQKQQGVKQQQQNSTRRVICLESLLGQVPSSLEQDSTFGARQEWERPAGVRGGSQHGSFSGGNFLRRGGCEHRSVCRSGPDPLPSPVKVTLHDLAATYGAEPQRLAQAVTSQVTAASSLGSHSFDCDECLQQELDRNSSAYTGDVLLIPSSIGGVASENERRGCPGERERVVISLVELCPAQPRGGHCLQDFGVRRDTGFGFGVSPQPGGSFEKIWQSPGVDPQHAYFSTQPDRSQYFSDRSYSRPATSEPWNSTCLQVQTWGSLSRFPQQVSGHHCNSTPGSLEKSSLCKKVSEGGKTGPTFRKSSQKSPTRQHSSGKGHQRTTCVGALSPQASLKAAVFLEIFCGTGRLGRAIHKDNHWPVLLWDISLGDEYDLRRRHNRWRIAGWLRAGLVRAGHLGTPCHSFSRARDRQPGPPPLRSDSQVMGLPNLSVADKQKVTEGNLFMRFSCYVMTLASVLHIPFTMENPARSRLWLCPAVQRMLRRKAIRLFTCEFCMFGTKWRKSTSFAASFVDLSRLFHFRCLGAKRGLCKRTDLPHMHLCGQTPDGRWMTSVAEPYPFKLCHVLAQCFASFEAQVRAENFQKRL